MTGPEGGTLYGHPVSFRRLPEVAFRKGAPVIRLGNGALYGWKLRIPFDPVTGWTPEKLRRYSRSRWDGSLAIGRHGSSG